MEDGYEQNALTEQTGELEPAVLSEPAFSPELGVQNRGGKGKKIFAIIAAISLTLALFALITAVVLVNIERKPFYNFQKSDLYFVKDDGALLIVTGSGTIKKIDLDDCEDFEYTAVKDYSGQRAVIHITRKITVFPLKTDQMLFMFDGRSVKEIVRSQMSIPFVFLSPDGQSAIYINDRLYFYYGGRSTLLAEDDRGIIPSAIDNEGNIGYVISDGKTALSYYYDGTQTLPLGDSNVLFLSTKGNLLYLTRQNEKQNSVSIDVQKGMDKSTRIKLYDNISFTVYMNYDATQALITGSKGTVFSKNGGEPVKVSDHELSPIIPVPREELDKDVIASQRFSDLESAYFAERSSGSIVSIKGGKRKVIATNIKREAFNDCHLSDDGKRIWYVVGQTIYYVDPNEENPEQRILAYTEKMDKWIVSSDAKTVFSADYYMNVYAHAEGSETTAKIFTGKGDYRTIFKMQYFRDKLYFIHDGKLYSSNGGKAVNVANAPEDITEIECSRHLMIIKTKGGGLFFSTNGKSFKKIK